MAQNKGKISQIMGEIVDLIFGNWNEDWEKAIGSIRQLNSIIIKNNLNLI